MLNRPVAKDKDGNILDSDEEILEAAEKDDLPDDFDYLASPADPSGRFSNAREAEAFDYSLEEDNGPR